MTLNFLKKPYPFTGNIRSYLVSNFLVGCFVGLFLIAFQPFGTNLWDTPHKTLKLLGFGLVSFIVPLVVNTVTLVFVSQKKTEDKWTTGKEILAIIFVLCGIALGNLLYGRLLHIMSLSLSAYFGALTTTCLVGIFPVTAHVLLKQKRLQKTGEEEAKKINDDLLALKIQHVPPETIKKTEADIPEELTTTKQINPQTKEQENIVLSAENEKDRLVLYPGQLICIASADNYSTIFYLESEAKKKLLLRSSLKRLESQLNDEMILRCHRTWIVNLRQVKKVEGNAAGYRLILEHQEEHIPVSRNYAPKVLQQMKALSS